MKLLIGAVFYCAKSIENIKKNETQSLTSRSLKFKEQIKIIVLKLVLESIIENC